MDMRACGTRIWATRFQTFLLPCKEHVTCRYMLFAFSAEGTMRPKGLHWAALAVSAAFLTACGGGGDGSDDDRPGGGPTTANPTGIWTGSTSTGRTVAGVVLGDGAYYVLYSQPGNPAVIAGVVQGSGSTSGSTFSSSNGSDFSFEGSGGIFEATVTATVATGQSFNGTIASPSSRPTSSFTTAYSPISTTPATPAAVAGSYTGTVVTSAGPEGATLAVSTDGSFSGTGASGCTVSGSVTPRTDVNAYNISVTFGPSPCLFPVQTFSGIAVLDGNLLRAAAPNTARTDGILFIGNRP